MNLNKYLVDTSSLAHHAALMNQKIKSVWRNWPLFIEFECMLVICKYMSIDLVQDGASS